MSKDWDSANYVVEIDVCEDRDYLEAAYKEEKTDLSFEDWVKQHGWKFTFKLMCEDGLENFLSNDKKPTFISFT